MKWKVVNTVWVGGVKKRPGEMVDLSFDDYAELDGNAGLVKVIEETKTVENTEVKKDGNKNKSERRNIKSRD